MVGSPIVLLGGFIVQCITFGQGNKRKQRKGINRRRGFPKPFLLGRGRGKRSKSRMGVDRPKSTTTALTKSTHSLVNRNLTR